MSPEWTDEMAPCLYICTTGGCTCTVHEREIMGLNKVIAAFLKYPDHVANETM